MSNMTASNIANLFREAIEETTSLEPTDSEVLLFARSDALQVREEVIKAMEALFETGRESLVPFEGGEWGILARAVLDFAPKHFKVHRLPSKS